MKTSNRKINKGDGGACGESMDGIQPRAGTPPPWLDGEAGTGTGGLEHRCGVWVVTRAVVFESCRRACRRRNKDAGDGMVVAPSMIGVLGDGMVKKEGARCQILIGGLLGDEGDEMDHPPHPKNIDLHVLSWCFGK
ncbi:hypothetical protein QVD17_20213 [Tagetes erecta]|uniref:Uncharacterized protein n=1 Tax=Tagetes erecta TaxID=13708 RepID=A0AAD8KR87_TARER|nr:hypothetical protein QVD17_20213 [Tagetes erecta]